MRTFASTLLALLTVPVLLPGCDCSGGTGPGDDAGSSGLDAAGLDAAGLDAPGSPPPDGAPIFPDAPLLDGGVVVTEDGGFAWSCFPVTCAGHMTECGDCVDNDGDGVVDSRDRECLGPCDNTEGPAFTTGVGGETGGPCRSDCYFDYGNGPGDDDCRWDHRCDPREVAPGFNPEGPACPYDPTLEDTRDCPATQSATCLDSCRPITPAGCDCFGCCTFPELEGRSNAEGGEFVWLGSVFEGTNDGSCTFDVIRDTSLCRPCTPVPGCYNDCGRCELCLGRTTLPPECLTPPPVDAGVPPPVDAGPIDGGGIDAFVPLPDAGPPPPPPPPRCDPGIIPCGLPTDPPCAADSYCITGCCQPLVF